MKLFISLIAAVLLLPQVALALCVQGDCNNGQGTIVLQDGRKYVGEFIDGIRSGRGLMTFPDGTKYLGDWQNDKPFGQGTLTSVGKFEYAGEFYNGVRQGQGTLETVDGKKYVGQWQNDVPHGRGKITYSDGSEFVGQFKGGRRNGEGEAKYTDGSQYIGQWKDDLPNGQGTKTYPDGKQHSGEFINGLMHGKGSVIMPDGGRFVGEWQGDILVKKEEIAPEAKHSTAEEAEGHVIAVVDEKPTEVKAVKPAEIKIEKPAEVKAEEPVELKTEKPAEVVVDAAEDSMIAEPVISASKVNVVNSNTEFASVKQNGVLVRSGPSTEYRIIRSVYKGFPVQIIENQEKWTQVKDSLGQEGWIYSPLLGNNNSAIVMVAKANLRSGAGVHHHVVSQIDFGTVLTVSNIKADWYLVTSTGGLKGWLSKELVWPSGHTMDSNQEMPAVEMTVPENLQAVQKIEDQDKMMAEDVMVVTGEEQFPKAVSGEISGDPVDVKDKQAEIKNQVVEEPMKAVEPSEAAETVQVEPPINSIESYSKVAEAGKEGNYASVSQNGKGANIRSEPTVASEVLRSVPPGFPLAIVERQGDWALVEDFRKRRGWVYGTLLADLETVVIKVGKGNLRRGPSTADEIVAKLDYSMVMFIQKTQGEWVQVSNPEGLVGWLHNDVIWP